MFHILNAINFSVFIKPMQYQQYWKVDNSHYHYYCIQGIINMNGNGNWANFFSYICNNKKIRVVRCVSSIIVVLNVKFARLLAAHANKNNSEKRRSPTRVPVLLVETHWRLTFIAVLTVHAETSLLYILSSDLYKLIEI